jgi:energy-coupling factor transporter ATP-binding protein EcfA2
MPPATKSPAKSTPEGPATPDPVAPPQPPAIETLFEQERSALGRLQAVVKARAAGEGIVAEAFAAATAEAEREVAKARKQIAASRKRAVEEWTATHHGNTAVLGDRHDGDEAEAEKTRRSLRKKTTDKYSATLQKLRAEYEDKSWTVESIREAGEKEAEDAHVRQRRHAAASGKRLEGLRHTAELGLTRVGLTWAAVEFRTDRLPSATRTDPIGKMEQCLEGCEGAVARLNASTLNALLRPLPTLGLVLLCGLAGGGISFALVKQWPLALGLAAGWAVLGGGFLRVLLGVFAKRQIRDRGHAFGVYYAEATRALTAYDQYVAATHAANLAEVASKHAINKARAAEIYEPRIATMEKQLAATLTQIETNYTVRMEDVYDARANETTTEAARHAKEIAHSTADHDRQLAEAETRCTDKLAAATAHRDGTWAKMSANWFGGVNYVKGVCAALTAFGDAHFPPWEAVARPDFKPVTTVPLGIRYGTLAVAMNALPNAASADARLAVAEPIDAHVPAYLPFPDAAAVMLKAKDDGRGKAVVALQSMMLRFLTGLPPGKVRFTIVDPVGLGENFAAFMNLADYDENLVTGRIWTEPTQIEQKLTDLTEHMENVIQKYLRNQYKSIEDYNRAAGEVAEPYRVLVIANFPHNFTSDAARRLVSVMASGPACGVCTLVSVDTRAALPRDFRLADLEQAAFVVNHTPTDAGGTFVPADASFTPFPLTVEGPPPSDVLAKIVRRIGQAGKDAARVEVPFDFIMPAKADVWKGDASKGFDIPIGRAGATRRQMLGLGKGTAQHALVAGKTGSGKSTLLHAMITNLALIYSPDEAELYLIDFKKGVEFKAYADAKLPHAKVIAIESEREFGLSVLQRLDGILRERGDRYRDAGANDLAGYREYLRKNKPGATCPRILFVVDEFQEFFVEDDKLAQEATLLLDRLVRQGRAFGVHVLLGSQTLGGAYSLARSTIDQMAVRIALQCSEADAQLILSKDNTAARLLNRPGEAIYNDANGLLEGNNPFQVVWLSEDRRAELLEEVRLRGIDRRLPPPLVFEGSTTADLFKNADLAKLIVGDPARPGPAFVYLGDPVAIKEPTTAVFRAQSAANLLMLGQQEEGALGLMVSSMATLVARYRAAPFRVLDGTPDDSEFAEYLRTAAAALGHPEAFAERGELPAVMAELNADLERRRLGEVERTPRFLFVHGLHRLRELRKAEDDYGFGKKSDKPATPGEVFALLMREGPPLGVHVVAWCDTLTNLTRAIDRQGLKEFALRVLFQMSPADSSQLIDTPMASRLGRHRAMFIEEGTERPEKFRPYGLPTAEQLRELGATTNRELEPGA